MAKPDLQPVYVRPDDGNLRRLDGKLGLALALENLPEFANTGLALDGGLEIGALYKTAGGSVQVVVPT